MQCLTGVFSDSLDFRKSLYFAFTLGDNWAGDRITDSNEFPAKFPDVLLNLIFFICNLLFLLVNLHDFSFYALTSENLPKCI